MKKNSSFKSGTLVKLNVEFCGYPIGTLCYIEGNYPQLCHGQSGPTKEYGVCPLDNKGRICNSMSWVDHSDLILIDDSDVTRLSNRDKIDKWKMRRCY